MAKNPSRRPGQKLAHVFVRAKAHNAEKEENKKRDYYINLADISCMFESGGKTILWRSCVEGVSVNTFEIPDMGIDDVAEALATQGVALVDLKQVSADIKAARARKTYKPVKP